MKIKKHFSLLLAASVLCGSCIIPQTAAAEPLIWGDVDESGEVDVCDAVLLSRYLLEDVTLSVTEQGHANADADSSGQTDQNDVIHILRKIAHLI